MKKILLKLFTLVLSCVMLCSMLAGCGNEKVDLDSNLSDYVKELREKWYIGKDKTLSWYIGLNWWSYNKAWTDYPVLKEVSQITGVIPKTTIAPDTDGQKLRLMMSTDRLPDYITVSPDDPIVEELITGGYVYSYDELIEKYCPEFADEIDPLLRSYTEYDSSNPLYQQYVGKLYGLNCFFVPDASKLGAISFNVRGDIYEEIGSPDMTSPEGFKNALQAVKDKYPDMIPLTLGDSWYRFVMEECFGIHAYYENDEGTIEMRMKDPAYRDFVVYMNDLYNSDLLDPEVFTKNTQALEEDLAAGKIFCYPCTFWGLDTATAALNAEDPGSNFISAEPMHAENVTVRFPGQSRRGWLTTLISKRCADPETAIKFARFMWSRDGNLLVCYGHEGEHYTIDEETNTITRTPAVEKARKEDLTKFENETGIFTQRLFQYPYYSDAPSTDPARLQNEDVANRYCYDNTIYQYKMSPESTSTEGKISTKIWVKYDTAYPKMVMASSANEALKILDETIAEMEDMGLSILEEYWTNQFAANIEKFGWPDNLPRNNT